MADKARELNEKHKISERAGEAATSVKESAQAAAQAVNAKLESSGAKEALKGFWSSTTSAAAGLAEKAKAKMSGAAAKSGEEPAPST